MATSRPPSPVALSTDRDAPRFADSSSCFWRAGAWRIAQSGACGACGRRVSGAIWEGEPCTVDGCAGRIGPTRDLQPLSAYPEFR